MKKLFLIAALVLGLSAPAFAADEATSPAADDTATVACKKEIGEKIKLVENASAEERAQFEAAVAECVAAKSTPDAAVEGVPAADVEPVAEPAAE